MHLSETAIQLALLPFLCNVDDLLADGHQPSALLDLLEAGELSDGNPDHEDIVLWGQLGDEFSAEDAGEQVRNLAECIQAELDVVRTRLVAVQSGTETLAAVIAGLEPTV